MRGLLVTGAVLGFVLMAVGAPVAGLAVVGVLALLDKGVGNS